MDAANHSVVCKWERQNVGIFSCMLCLISVISGNRNGEAHQQAVPTAAACWGPSERLNWYSLRGTFPLLQKVQIEIILPAGRRFLFPGTRSIIIPRCGDLYFHLLLQYWFIRNIVAFKITTFVCGYLFEMMSKYCITFYVHYLLVVDWSPFNVICMCSCQVTFTQIWKKKC